MGETFRQVDVRLSYRELRRSPGHVEFGIWVNGGKAGDLIVRLDEEIAFRLALARGGFVEVPSD